MSSRRGFVSDGDHAVPAGPLRPLDRALREIFPGASWNLVRELIRSGKARVPGRPRAEATTLVRPGETITVRLAAPRPTRVRLPSDAIVHTDLDVVVVNKPPAMSTVPNEHSESDTLDLLLRRWLRAGRHRRAAGNVAVVHRLDRDTSGLLVFARNHRAQLDLKQQLRERRMHRRYLALVHGHPRSRVIQSRLVRDRGDGLRGSTDHSTRGKPAVTQLRVVERVGPASLVECRLQTGRTHQIRIHLSELGHPVLGERVYCRSQPLVTSLAPRQMLHAAGLAFRHPADHRDLQFDCPLPDDMRDVLERLRRG